ncbi:MAG: DUF1284 domain-containing protein [Acetatifactor sp.]
MQIKLRPHHLLCTQGYSGKGYNQEFVENMNEIVRRLRTEKATEITVVFSTDDLCAHCPNMVGTDLCTSQEKVKRFDRKTAEYFGLEEKTYIYQELIQKINSQMTSQRMDDICDGCQWYPVSSCKRNILTGNN